MAVDFHKLKTDPNYLRDNYFTNIKFKPNVEDSISTRDMTPWFIIEKMPNEFEIPEDIMKDLVNNQIEGHFPYMEDINQIMFRNTNKFVILFLDMLQYGAYDIAKRFIPYLPKFKNVYSEEPEKDIFQILELNLRDEMDDDAWYSTDYDVDLVNRTEIYGSDNDIHFVEFGDIDIDAKELLDSIDWNERDESFNWKKCDSLTGSRYVIENTCLIQTYY